jgi:hypothetical protein
MHADDLEIEECTVRKLVGSYDETPDDPNGVLSSVSVTDWEPNDDDVAAGVTIGHDDRHGSTSHVDMTMASAEVLLQLLARRLGVSTAAPVAVPPPIKGQAKLEDVMPRETWGEVVHALNIIRGLKIGNMTITLLQANLDNVELTWNQLTSVMDTIDNNLNGKANAGGSS